MLKRMIKKIKDKTKAIQEDNRGLTLVELLVAIVILTMVMMPISRMFITAGGINKKARIEQQANLTANSVLESAKAFAIKDFYNQCKANSYANFTLIANKSAEDFSTAIFTQYDTANTTALTGSFVTNNPTYAFKINGLKQNNTSYDAVLIYEKVPFKSVKIDSASSSTISESQIESIFTKNSIEGAYYKNYSIRVYIYPHGTDVSAESFSPNNKGNALVMITGSKLDSVKG